MRQKVKISNGVDMDKQHKKRLVVGTPAALVIVVLAVAAAVFWKAYIPARLGGGLPSRSGERRPTEEIIQPKKEEPAKLPRVVLRSHVPAFLLLSRVGVQSELLSKRGTRVYLPPSVGQVSLSQPSQRQRSRLLCRRTSLRFYHSVRGSRQGPWRQAAPPRLRPFVQ